MLGVRLGAKRGDLHLIVLVFWKLLCIVMRPSQELFGLYSQYPGGTGYSMSCHYSLTNRLLDLTREVWSQLQAVALCPGVKCLSHIKYEEMQTCLLGRLWPSAGDKVCVNVSSQKCQDYDGRVETHLQWFRYRL